MLVVTAMVVLVPEIEKRKSHDGIEAVRPSMR